MPVDVYWDNDHSSVLMFKTKKGWTAEEFHDGLAKTRELVASAINPPLGLVILPGGVAPKGLMNLLKIGLQESNRLNLTSVIISPPQFTVYFYNALEKAYRMEGVKFAENVEDAVMLLQKEAL